MKFLLISLFLASFVSADTYIQNSIITDSIIGNNISSSSNNPSSFINRQVIVEESFSKVHVNFPLELSIKKTSKNNIKLKVDKKFKDNISFKVYNDTLHINLIGSINTRLRTKVTIGIPSLNELKLGNTTDANVKGFNSNNLKLLISGTAKVNFSLGSIENLFLEAKGTSKIHLEKISISNATIIAKGTSKIMINVNNNLNVTLSGVSKVRYLGNPSIKKTLNNLGKLIKIK
jgi:hypothetical protein